MRAMRSRRLPLILTMAVLPALIGCSREAAAPPPTPLDQSALKAVVDKPGVNRERLARSVDALFTQPVDPVSATFRSTQG